MSIFEHFHKEEHEFIEKGIEWKNAVETTYEKKLTDFLDPREQDILASVIGKDETVLLSFWGGTAGCERKRALLYPFYEEGTEEAFELSVYEISYPSKFVTINHRDILGSLTGLGLDRRKFGDIIEHEGRFQFVTATDIAPYIQMNLKQIGKGPVSLHKVSAVDVFPVKEIWEEEVTTVASFRLDALIAKLYNLSRNKALSYIEKKLVKVNWKVVESAAHTLQSGDYLSVRGEGRRKLIAIEGQTKKGRWKVTYGRKRP